MLSSQAELLLNVWLDERRSEGFEIKHSPLNKTGYPDKIILSADNATFSLTQPDANWKGSFGKIIASSTFLGLDKIKITTDTSKSTWDIQGHVGKGYLTSGPLDIDLLIKEGALDRGKLKTTSVIVVDKQGQKTHVNSLKLGISDQAPPAVAMIKIDAGKLTLPAGVISPLGNVVEKLQTTLILDKPIAPGQPRLTLSMWQASGGKIEVTSLAAEHGPLNLKGEGTVSLDKRLQPIAAFTIKAQGVQKALRALIDQNIVPQKNALLARIALATMSKPSPINGKSTLEIPLTLQDQMLSAGPMQIIKLPMIRWD